MGLDRKSDLLLIFAVIILVMLAMVPSEKRNVESTTERTQQKASFGQTPDESVSFRDDDHVNDKIDETLRAVERHRSDIAEAASLIRRPNTEGPDREFVPPNAINPKTALMPLKAGATWVFEVFGDEKLVHSDTWTMRMIREPEGTVPGIVETRIGDKVNLSPLHVEKGGIRLGGLPLVAPIELSGTRTVSGEGTLLPARARMIEGAVWYDTHHRQLLYSYHDNKGKRHEEQAKATIRNRAHVGKFETVVVPAGRFGAYRVSWLSRVEIKAEGRPILEHLTTEPFRREIMWVAPGIGIVKREVDYLPVKGSGQTVTLSLTDYTPADDCVFSDP